MPYKRISDLQDGTLESGSYVPIDKSEGTTQRYDLYELQNVVEGYLYNGTFYADSSHSEAITGETGKIYVDLPNNVMYRWSGSAYVSIPSPIDFATQAEATAGTNNTKAMTPLRTRQAIDTNAYQLPLMSADVRGGAKLGNGLEIENGKLKVIGLYVDEDGDWCQE